MLADAKNIFTEHHSARPDPDYDEQEELWRPHAYDSTRHDDSLQHDAGRQDFQMITAPEGAAISAP
jgi:hypothetical protein